MIVFTELKNSLDLIITHIGHVSLNPFFRTIPPLQQCRGGFLFLSSVMASLDDKFYLAKPDTSMAIPPYEPARLVNDEKPITAKWYIVFYAWDAEKETLIRKRDYEINKHKTKAKRIEFARKRIAEINSLLSQGYYFSKRTKKQQALIDYAKADRDYTVKKAFDFILPIIKKSKRPETYNSYNSVAGLFLSFCKDVGWHDWKIRTLTKTDIISWLDYCQTNEERPVGNTTRNNYKSFLSGMFSLMVEREILKVNPAFGIKGVAEDQGGNIAYTPEQLEVLKPAIKGKEPRLWLFITFMLYGFIRPGEIARLQVKYIDLKKNVIYLPGTITKNRKPRHVKVSAPFKKYIEELELDKHPGQAYIFGYNLITGMQAIQKNFANKMHHDIARPLGFGPEYTLYSLKHTGVIIHYKAGIDIKTLQEQIGHQSLEETDIYLKSLNLYKNSEIEEKSPVI